MTQVNPPHFLNRLIPIDELTKDEVLLWREAIRVMTQLYNRSGATVDKVDSQDENLLLSGRLSDLESRVPSGEALTFDDDGFSWDTDQFSWDQDEV